MNKYLLKFFLSTISLALLTFSLFIAPATLLAQGADLGPEPAMFEDLEVMFERVLGIIVSLAGVTVFIMVVISGYQFLTSGGDPQKAAGARGTLTWAVVGLVFLLGCWLILLTIRELTGVDVTTFDIPT